MNFCIIDLGTNEGGARRRPDIRFVFTTFYLLENYICSKSELFLSKSAFEMNRLSGPAKLTYTTTTFVYSICYRNYFGTNFAR